MHRLSSLWLALLLVASLSACGEPSAERPPAESRRAPLPAKCRQTRRSESVQIRSRDDLTCLEACEVLAGTLTLGADAQVDVAVLPNLREIEGGLYVHDSTALKELRLPRLEEVLGSLRIAGNAALVAVDLGKLRSVARLDDLGHAAKKKRSSDSANAHFRFEIERNPELSDLSGLQDLRELVGLFSFEDNDKVRVLDLPQLRRVEIGFSVGHCDALEKLSANAIEHLSKTLVVENPRLAAIEMRRLRSASLSLVGNPRLVALRLDALETIGGTWISGERSLPAYRFEGNYAYPAAAREELERRVKWWSTTRDGEPTLVSLAEALAEVQAQEERRSQRARE